MWCLSLLVGKDIGVIGIKDSEGRVVEEFIVGGI